MQSLGSEKLVDIDAYKDLMLARAESAEFDNSLREYERILEVNDKKVDAGYKNFLLYILTKEERVETHRKRNKKDDVNEHDIDSYDEDDDDSYDEDDNDSYGDEDSDRQYELYLKSLKEREKSYGFDIEKYGLQYEGNSSSDEECDLEPKRKLRSATKQQNGPSKHMPGVGNQCKHDSQSTSSKETKNLTRRKLRNKAKTEKIEKVKSSTIEMVPDPDYLFFNEALRIVDGHYVYTYGGHTVVYEMDGGEDSQEKEEHHDEWSSDVEILDSTSFYKEVNQKTFEINENSILDLGSPPMQSEFRHQLIAVLRKPFDKQEHNKLWLDVKLRKPGERHLELRNGRERSCAVNKHGKSYLDYHPDFERQLSRYRDDKPKCLNLLRGFFFWLQNFLQDGSFRPWQDAECLSIYPESC